MTNERGMTLVEVLVATVIVMVAVLSVSAVYLRSAGGVNRSVGRAEAARLVQAIRAYTLDEVVDAGTGQVTDATIRSNEAVPPLVAFAEGQEMLPANLAHSPVKLVWEVAVTLDGPGPGYVDPGTGVRRHIAATTVALDIEHDGTNGGVVSSGDTVLLKDSFFIFDLEP
ncbi:MAG: type II secretion system protein [Planctomycetes bacterium]|nr:type II secretion system protein [Planctomycetota bacterium]